PEVCLLKAAAFSAFGPSDVLQLVQLDVPQAGAGQVRVRVKAAGVQPIDCWVRAGRMPPWATRQFPQIPGNEFAGVVDQVGEGVDSFFVGSEVLGFTTLGCYAELVVVSADQVVSRPAALSCVEAALDGAGGEALQASLALVANRDRILTLVEHDRAESLGIRVIRGQRSAARLAALVDLCVQGALRVQIRRAYPLRLAADAHRE